jgi:hypothetical protein
MMLVTGEKRAEELGLPVAGRLVSAAVAGVEPSVMGTGMIPASRMAMKKAGLSVDDLDAVEANEAFASIAIAVGRELEVPEEKLNPVGGAVALGHPIGATGAVLTVKILHHLARTDGRYGLVTSASAAAWASPPSSSGCKETARRVSRDSPSVRAASRGPDAFSRPRAARRPAPFLLRGSVRWGAASLVLGGALGLAATALYLLAVYRMTGDPFSYGYVPDPLLELSFALREMVGWLLVSCGLFGLHALLSGARRCPAGWPLRARRSPRSPPCLRSGCSCTGGWRRA